MIGLWAAALVQSAAMQPATTGDLALDTFRAACIPHRQDHVALNAALEASGWSRVEETDHPELAATQAKARAEIESEDTPEMTLDLAIWGKTVEGRRFYVIASRMDALIGETEDDDGDGVIEDHEKAMEFDQIGCGLWDFDATAPIAPGAMTAWTASLPVQSFDQPGLIIGGTWNVFDMMPGTGEVHVGFIPDGSPFVERTGFSGVSITMSSATLDDEPAADGENRP
jgi:hypothetical protein